MSLRSQQAWALRAVFAAIAIVALGTSCGGGGGGSAGGVPPPTLQSVSLAPANISVELGVSQQLTATAKFSDGSTKDVTAVSQWSSTNVAAANVDSNGLLTTLGIGTGSIEAIYQSTTGTAPVTVSSPGHFLMRSAGLWVQFERRGWPAEFWPGEIIQNWNLQDTVLGTTVSAEVSLQLDQMKAMGVNTITVELRTADPTGTGIFVPPACNEPPVLGFQWPQPSQLELTNLPLFFNMVQAKGMKVWLMLNNTHMEEQPPANSQTWLGAILGVIGSHPALDLVMFGGDSHVNPGPNGTSACGIPAEPPLWLGPTAIPAAYVQWAIGYAMSLGIASSKLSAEAIVGSYFIESTPPAGSNATSGHLWSPIAVEKTIFDNLKIPANQRTYALSFYEHRKCVDAGSLACNDVDPHTWADQTLLYVTSMIGAGPRIVVPEMGNGTPVDQVNWATPHALESLVFLLHKYSVDGGSFWRWVSNTNTEDADPTLATPVKPRGVAFAYNQVQKDLLDMAGFHLPALPNGSFEGAVAASGVPVSWSASGSGSVTQYLLTQEAGQPEVPSRGTYAMRMVTGNGSSDLVTSTSALIPVVPTTAFTTTSNLRFSWTGDPNPAGAPALRPQVFVTISYYQQNQMPSAVRAQDTIAYFQESSTTGFATFPFQYVTPTDAAFVAIVFGAKRNRLPTPITLDVDNVR